MESLSLRFKERFEGLNPKFVEVIFEDSNTGVKRRYAKLLDYIQYNNPPYNQHEISRELNIPQPSISRSLTRLREYAGTRIRADMDLNKTALETLHIIYHGILHAVIPAEDWASSVWWTNMGTLYIYRIPPQYEKTLLNQVTSILGEPDEVIGIKSTILAKPSIEYYLVGREHINPVEALKILDKHPQISRELIDLTPSQYEMKFRDPRTLELMTYLEHDVIIARERFIEKYGEKMYNQHIGRVSKIIRGTRAMYYDHEDSVLIFLQLETSRRCNEHLVKTLSLYLYTTNISLTDDNNLVVLFTIPYKYSNDVIKWILDQCGPGVRFKSYMALVSGNQLRQYVPWMNFNKDTRDWDFNDVPKLTLSRLLKETMSVDVAREIYYQSTEEYVEYLVKVMGRSYAENIVNQLPLHLKEKATDVLSKVLEKLKGDGSASP